MRHYSGYEVDDFYKFNEEKNMKGHSIRTLVLLGVVFVIAGLQTLHGDPSFGNYADMGVVVLLALEHILAGKTE